MNLKEYLKTINERPYPWAKKHGLNHVQVWKYVKGKSKRPDATFAAAVERATKGMVSRMDVLYPEDPK